MSLSQLLQQSLETSNAQHAQQARSIFDATQVEMRKLDLETKARGVGDYLADVPLKNMTGDDVSIPSLYEEGPLIVTFFWGGWSPFCTLKLRAYQEMLCKITARGGNLVAITPEHPGNTRATTQNNALTFPILTDVGNCFARTMGISFELPVKLQNLFRGAEISLPDLNAETGWILPSPATFVVDSTDRIVLADDGLDFTRWLEPAQAVKALRPCIHPQNVRSPP